MLRQTILILVTCLGVMGSSIAFADDLPLSIDAQTGKKFYEYGDSVGVSGKIKNYDADTYSGTQVTYEVFDPNGKLVVLGNAEPGEFGAFSFNFVARGELFLPEGNYSIKISFSDIQTELPMFFSGGELEVEDDIPPIILQQKDIEVFANSPDGLVQVTFDIVVTDNVDKKIIPTCKPESGFLFGIGETIIKCTAKDSSGNFAVPMTFTVKVSTPVTSIPSWVRNVAGFWCADQIDDESFVQGLQYLIDNGIIVVPATSQKVGEPQEVPQWVKNNACWWYEGAITDFDFAKGIEFLVKEGIIIV